MFKVAACLVAVLGVLLVFSTPVQANTITHSFETPFWEHVRVGNAIGETNQVVDPPGASSPGEYMKVWLMVGLNGGDTLKRTGTFDVSDDVGEDFHLSTRIDCDGEHNNTQTLFESVFKDDTGQELQTLSTYLNPGSLPFTTGFVDVVPTGAETVEVSIGVRVNPLEDSGGGTTCFFDYVIDLNANIPQVNEGFESPQWNVIYEGGLYNDADCERVAVSGGSYDGDFAVRVYNDDAPGEEIASVGCEWRVEVKPGEQVDVTARVRCDSISGTVIAGVGVVYKSGDYNNPSVDDIELGSGGVFTRVSSWTPITLTDITVLDGQTGYGYVRLYLQTWDDTDLGICLFDAVSIEVNEGTCFPPQVGNWDPEHDCTVRLPVTVDGNITINSGVTITVEDVIFIDLSQHHILVKNGGKLIIKGNGKIAPTGSSSGFLAAPLSGGAGTPTDPWVPDFPLLCRGYFVILSFGPSEIAGTILVNAYNTSIEVEYFHTRPIPASENGGFLISGFRFPEGDVVLDVRIGFPGEWDGDIYWLDCFSEE